MKNKLYFITLFILSLFLNASSCSEKPGKGKKAEKGYKVCSPIIFSLENYYSKNGFYPDSLKILVPNFIDEIPAKVDNYPLNYEIVDSGKSFSLMFSYSPPGINHCTYTPEKKWDCYGYY